MNPIAAGFLGAAQGIGNLGEQTATADEIVARQQGAAAEAAQKEKARLDAIAQRKQKFDAQMKAKLAKKPVGTPFTNTEGKLVQRFYDPATATLSVEPVGSGADATPENPAQAHLRMLKSIGMSDADAQKAVQAKFGPQPEKKTALEQKYDTYLKLFGKKEADRMMEVEGGLLPRPKAAGAAGGPAALTGGNVSDSVKFYATQIANGKAKLSDVPAKEKEAVSTYMQQKGMKPMPKPTAPTQTAAERSFVMKETGARILEELDDPEIQAHLGPVNGRATQALIALGNAPEKVAKFYYDLVSFGAFQAGQHPVRGIGALEYFDKRFGGLAQTADQLKGKLASAGLTADSVMKSAKTDEPNQGDTVTVTIP